MRTLEAGQVLPEWSLPMTPTTIVSTAIATRDWQDVHHDRDVAQAAGSKDIFMNILTTNGLVEKFVVDWAGHDAELKGIAIRLGAPAHPYDTLTFSGTVDLGRGRHRDHRRRRPGLARRPRHRHRQGGRCERSLVRGKAAIAGIGATEFSKESGRSELQLSVEAVRAALADCGLSVADVDGLTTFTMDTSSEIAVARELGIPELRFFSRINYGGGAACATVQQAAMAVATGVADVVVCYRGFNERSESRFGQFSLAAATQVNTNGLDNAWTYPMGLGTPAATVAMQARRYMHEYGATSEDFGAVAVADRRHAATNPDAFFYEQADHPRGPPGLPDDRRPAAPARLLPGERRRGRAGRHLGRAGPRPAPAAGGRRGGGPGQRRRPVRHDVLLPRRHRHPRDGRGRPRAVAPVDARPRRHADGDPLRPLHAVRPHAARGARLLRPRRGQGLHRRTAPSRSAAGCRSTPTAASSARPTSTA